MNASELIDVLMELRVASKINAPAAMKSYNMLFLGSEMNYISAIELQNCMVTRFQKSITMDELLELIPAVCPSLNMPIEPLVQVGDPDRKIADYQIKLW